MISLPFGDPELAPLDEEDDDRNDVRWKWMPGAGLNATCSISSSSGSGASRFQGL